jgi:hypothetical protein
MSIISQVATLYDLPSPLRALAWHLLDRSYSQWAMTRILAQVETTGELATSVAVGLLDAEDEAGATDAYVEAMAPVPYDAPEWGDDRSVPPDAAIVPPELDPEDMDTLIWPAPVVDPHDGESFEAAVPVGPARPVCGGAPAGGFRRIVHAPGGSLREEAAEEAAVREALARMYGAASVDRLVASMREDGRTVAAGGVTFFWDPWEGGSPPKLPPVAGGGPADDEKAEALAHERLLDELAEIRRAEDRAPLYGWE